MHTPAWLPGEFSPIPGTHYHSVIVILLHPISRGSVHIASADPFAHPAIDPNYLSNPVELDLMVHAVKFAQKIMMTGALKRSHGKFTQPSPDVTSYDDLKEWVTKYGTHLIYSLGMLPRADGGVVDSNLVVYGTKNLRVVDACILPIQISCHTQRYAEQAIKLRQACRVGGSVQAANQNFTLYKSIPNACK
ncbi:hypothetical protein BD779DRAFT_1438457 [Infundibulicybe gibba]|nr:hypothetical protein BD779DRAFT_1438457 [Infundibulicybe gibba]